MKSVPNRSARQKWAIATVQAVPAAKTIPKGQTTQWAQGNCGCNGTGH